MRTRPKKKLHLLLFTFQTGRVAGFLRMTAVKGPDIRNESRVRVNDLFDCFITPAG